MKKKIFASLVVTVMLISSFSGIAAGNMMVDTTLTAGKLVALKDDGTVKNYGYNLMDATEQNSLEGVIQIACEEVGGNSFFALKNDGTVTHIFKYKKPEFDAVSKWQNIIQIDAGNGFVAGVDESGKVYICGSNAFYYKKALSWSDIKSIYVKEDNLVGLDSLGRVYVTSLFVDSSKAPAWENMEKVIFDTRCFWGIDSQGNLISSDNVYNSGKINGKELLGDFVDIDCLSAYSKSGYFSSILALKKDGTLINIYNFGTSLGTYKAEIIERDVAGFANGNEKYVLVLKNGKIISDNLPINGVDWILGVDIRVDGKYIDSDVSPFIESGRTMVPIRAISEALGAQVGYDDSTKTATITRGEDVLRITMNSDVAYVNGKGKNLDVAAKNINSRIFVPARFVSESFGCNVEWLDITKSVLVTTK